MSFSDLPERVPSVKYPVVSQPISHPGLPLASGQGPVDPKIAQGYYGPGPLDPAPKSNNKILGLRPAIFWIIIVLLVVILAGALGGGLGGGLAAHSHSSSSVTPVASQQGQESGIATATGTPTSGSKSSSSSTTTAASAIPTAFVGCPLANQTLISSAGQQFTIMCQMDFGSDSLNVQNFTTDTFMDCLQACTTFSSTNQAAPCKAVAWDQDAPNFPQNTKRCWLKTSVGATHYEDYSFQTIVIAYISSN